MGNESRFQEKQQIRRQRGFVNIGLSLVLLTVGMISYQLFFTTQTKGKEHPEEKKVAQIASKEEKNNKLDDRETKQSEEELSKEQENKEIEKQKLIEQQNQETESSKVNVKEQQNNENQVKKQEEQQNNTIEEQKANEEEINKNQPDKNADQTEQNKQWKPIGTEQGTKPAMQFKEGTTDWNEMKKAISYAVDVPESQLIYDFIGNNGTNKAYGNVRDKQSNKKYKVYIDWVENKGWKPVSVQAVK
ncbi:YrrS family protein [Bacillus bingmayongensis]|uniref:YrrS family protein n=1 Tax=Bacillus bingmayongensis TaxID=1150157 RepID=UPI0002F27B4C|nr:YrrS family protein [Bacillus bingmayongensis]MBY0599442.1 DUF1510 family protein [Bacillus bingmayongensis]